ncbi:MAG: hypothetical protein LBC85_01150 [Fibromonadaceae bacterium]|nr:hypothetical protein [Fibromonadaceae bacterium]
MKFRFILLATALIGGLTICSCDSATIVKLKTEANPKYCGTVTPPGTVKYNIGLEAKATATANADCVFLGWSGASTSINPTITITMNSNHTLVANFFHPRMLLLIRETAKNTVPLKSALKPGWSRI